MSEGAATPAGPRRGPLAMGLVALALFGNFFTGASALGALFAGVLWWRMRGREGAPAVAR